jgi:uncharacterized protein (DUF1501 family)
MTASDFASVDRRRFVRTLGAATLSLFLPPGAARAQAASAVRPVLVCLFLRGGADGLSLCVPHGHGEYYRARPRIAIARPGQPGGAVRLDDEFGLHPRLAPLEAAYRAGELALVHAVGSPDPTRSHFEAQDYMESALPGQTKREGWLGRWLASAERSDASPLRALALGGTPPLALQGHAAVLSARRLDRLSLAAPDAFAEPMEEAFRRMYEQAPASDPELASLRRAGSGAILASRRLRELDVAQQRPHGGAVYPKESVALADVATLIRAGVGLELAWIDAGGWDTHQNQGNGEQGRLPRVLSPWGQGLAAFRQDLGAHFEHVLVLVMTEFGRTLRENGSGGTDHGHASAMLLMGGRVRGGRVHGRFPGLRSEQLWQGRDLAVTTDYRDVYAELLRDYLKHDDVARVLPDYSAGSRLGLFRA